MCNKKKSSLNADIYPWVLNLEGRLKGGGGEGGGEGEGGEGGEGPEGGG